LVLLAVSAAAFGCASGATDGNGGSGGTPSSSGGTLGSGAGGNATSGSGGATSSGGSTGSGGTNVSGTGGAPATGGAPGAGGSPGTGGASATGGATGTGGSSASGGGSGTGGSSGTCAGTLTKCGTICVDTTGSQTNCGACGTACRSDQSCYQSACKCPTGQGDCGGSCKDITASITNCGACGTACAAGATCVTGVCQCPAGQTACSAACTNLNTDGKNCGSCGKVCGSGTSCLFGACLDPTSLTCTPSVQANKSSTNAASITLGKYWINNNEWGASTGSGTQAIWSTCQQGDLIGWGTSWNWAGTTNKVKSYSSSVLGWQYGWKLTDSGLPLQISAGNQLNCGWSFNFTQSGGSADVSYDMFLHAIQMPGTNDTPTDEIMIWLYTANGAAPTGTKQTTVTIDSASWDLYRGTTTWNVFSYVRTANATSAVVNVMDFLNDLVSRGWVQSSKYLTSVQSGTEIFTGTGELDTTGYYCRVQ
jgi:xyloglucan-specific endo-beta-1,4-glucanase